jgi:hypothetical protein
MCEEWSRGAEFDWGGGVGIIVPGGGGNGPRSCPAAGNAMMQPAITKIPLKILFPVRVLFVSSIPLNITALSSRSPISIVLEGSMRSARGSSPVLFG